MDFAGSTPYPPEQPYVPNNDYPPYRNKAYQEMYLEDIAAHGHNSVLIHDFMDLFATKEFITTGPTTLPSGWQTGAGGDAYVRAESLLVLADIGGLQPKLFLTALRDPVPLLFDVARAACAGRSLIRRA